jgi:cell wall-associated NlpC family hydrolase
VSQANIGQQIADAAIALATRNLQYTWGSSDPASGGLDCSGFVLHIFQKEFGIKLPHQSGRQLEYLRKNGRIWDAETNDWSPEILTAGDLIFWTGTFSSRRKSPITHVMIYIGNNQIAGSQNHAARLSDGKTGVGIYNFIPTQPLGNPSQPTATERKIKTLYAYARFK